VKTVFADTGYWLALLVPTDELHTKATAISVSLGQTRIVTSQSVLVEFLNQLAGYGAPFRQAAVNAIEAITNSANITVVEQTGKQFQSALLLYRTRLDKNWSLTDCASFLIMRHYRIKEALAFDKHFEQAGFVALLRG